MTLRLAVALLLVGIVVSSLQKAGAQALTGDTLSVKQGASIDQADANVGSLENGLKFGQFGAPRKPGLPRPRTGEGIASKRTAGGNSYGLDEPTTQQTMNSITIGAIYSVRLH